MDPTRFDHLTKSLATRQTRRGVLRTIGGGIAAGLAALGFGGAEAAPGGRGKGGGSRCGGPDQPCKWNKQSCEYSGLVCLNDTCGCEDNCCPNTGARMAECLADRSFNPDTCACDCLENTCSTSGECMPACGENMVFNAERCACECDAGHCCACIDEDFQAALCLDVSYSACPTECAGATYTTPTKTAAVPSEP